MLIWALGVMAAPPFFQTLIHGQTSFFLLAGFVLLIPTLSGSRRTWPPTIGLVLIAHKPQMALLPVAYLLFAGEWRVVVRAGAVIAALSIASMAALGWRLAFDYVRLLVDATQWHDSNGISIWGMFGWNAFFAGLGVGTAPARVLTLVADMGTFLAAFSWAWRARGTRHEATETRLAVLVFGALLISPHVYEHDVLLAAVPCFMLAMTGSVSSRIVWSAFSCFGWILLYFHFDLLVATSINFTVVWLAAGLLLAVTMKPGFDFAHGTQLGRRLGLFANAEGSAS